MSEESLVHKIRGLAPWFHNLHLPDGTQTAPDHALGDFPSCKWREIAPVLPQSLDGWTVLDIGCNAGFYSFELARRGARVLGIDCDPRYLAQAEWAATELKLRDRVEFRQMQVYDVAKLDRRFDLVLFMGVFYHLRYPLLALDVVSSKVGSLMLFQTMTMPGEEVLETPEDLPLAERDRMLDAGWPKMAFIERRCAGDPTNWFAPNHACVLAMLRSCGFRVISRPGHEIYLCAPDAAALPLVEEWRREELDSARESA